MSDMKQVIGTLVGIEEKPSGWFEVKVAMPGKDYPVRLDTKRENLIEDARATRGQVATWTFKESESDKINERSGKPYVNRYFEAVELGASAEAQASDSEDRMSKEEWAAKDSAIHMMASIKAAADALKHTVPPEPDSNALNIYSANVLFLAKQWHSYVLTERDGGDEGVPF